jgi:hypothetical protein
MADAARIRRLLERGLDPAEVAARVMCHYREVARVKAAIEAEREQPCAARDVPIGTCWAFIDHRTQAELHPPELAGDPLGSGAAPPSEPSPAAERVAGVGTTAPSRATPPPRRAQDEAAIAAFLACRGATKLPPGYAAPSSAEISDADRAFHAARYAEQMAARSAKSRWRGGGWH